MNKNLLLFAPLVMIIFIVGISIFTIKIIFTREYENPLEKEEIIEKWINNKELFENSAEELNRNSNNIFLARENDGYIRIKQKEKKDEYSNIETIKKDRFKNYTKTIYLMDHLNIAKVYKLDEEIIFEINKNSHFLQKIIYTENINTDQYNSSHYIAENIKDQWYYIEESETFNN